MYRPLDQAKRDGRLGRVQADGLEGLGGQSRRGHVDGLLKVGALEGIRLVEHRQDLKGAAAQEALDGHLHARDVALDQQRRLRVLAGLGEDRPDSLGRDVGRRRIVGADHAPARRQRNRLDHAGKADLAGELRHVRVGPGDPVVGLAQAGGREGSTHRGLVRGRRDRLGRVVCEPQARGGQRGHQHALLVGAHHGVERLILRPGDDGVGGGLGPPQVHDQRPVSDRPRQRLPALGGDHHLGVQRPRRGEEIARAVGGYGQQQKNPGHGRIVGSGGPAPPADNQP